MVDATVFMRVPSRNKLQRMKATRQPSIAYAAASNLMPSLKPLLGTQLDAKQLALCDKPQPTGRARAALP